MGAIWEFGYETTHRNLNEQPSLSVADLPGNTMLGVHVAVAGGAVRRLERDPAGAAETLRLPG